MRGGIALLALACVGAAHAQMIGPGISKAFELVKAKQGGTPVTGTGANESQGGRIPEPEPSKGQQLRVINADDYSRAGNEVLAEGNVHIIYKGYDVFADRVVGDLSTNIFILEGNGRLIGRTEEIEGERIQINFDDETFTFERGRAVLQPERLENQSAVPLYVKGARGGGRENDILTEDGDLTTCELESPHFHLHAKSTRVIPRKHIILKQVKLEVLGATILSLPGLTIPLDRDPQKYLPEVGQSEDEGYYIKFKFSTPLKHDTFIDHKVDLMSKLGIGLGGDYQYRWKNSSGRINAYSLVGNQRTLRSSIEHTQYFGQDSLSLAANFNRFNYLTAPESTQLDARASYAFRLGNGQARAGWYRSSSQSSGFESISENFSFNDSRELWNDFRTSLDVNLSSTQSNGFGSQTKTERIDLRFLGTQELRSLTAELLYQRSIPVGGGNSYLSSSDRTPLVTLRSDARRMFGEGAGRVLPWQMEFSVGELSDPGQEQERITRLYLDWGFRRSDGGRRLRVSYGGQFKQGMYSDDTAQYTLNYDTSLSYEFGQNSSFNVNYRRLASFGYTPLFMDRTGSGDALNADLSWQPVKTLRLAAQTGYDLLQIERGYTPWQSVSVRAEFTPRELSRYSLSAYYDTFSQAWSSARLDADVKVGRMWFTFAARYDGLRSQWAGATLIARGLRYGKLGADLLFDYNGYTQQFDATQFALTYSLHCFEAVLEVTENKVGFRPGRQVAFFVRIKAFPNTDLFGFGRRGQQIGTGGFGG